MAAMIAHFDIDAFYASVAVREDPTLAGKPLAIAGRSRRAVVLTASYEARPFGVRSAMPLWRALQNCPQLIVVPPNYELYKNASREIFALYAQDGRAVEALSLDEAFVRLGDISIAQAESIVAQLREAVLRATGLTVSAGVSQAKMVSKIASDLCKPNGCKLIAPGEEAEFLAPLPVGRLWGIGPKTAARLHARNIETIGQIANLSDAQLHGIFGSWGLELRDLARGIDTRTVEPSREIKSISTEETFEYDVSDEAALLDVLREQSGEIATKLEREGLYASTIGIKIKRADFSVVGRQTHLAQPTCDAQRIFDASAHCLRRAELRGAPVRLIGTRSASLVSQAPAQTTLF